MLTNEQLRDRIADAILAATYPAEEWPDGPPGEGEMDTARTEADAVMAVVGPELERIRADAKQLHDTYQNEVNARDEFFGDLLELLPGAEDTGMDAYDQIPRAVKALRADRDRAREIAVALEQQLAEIKRLAYMGGQNGEIIRGWIIGVLERANATDPQGQQDMHVCSPQTCGAVYDHEEDGL